MHVEFIPINGTPTRCIVAGDPRAQPLLLIHGLTLNAEIWIHNVDALAQTCFVIAPDLLGQGYSGPVAFDGRHTLAQKVEHLIALLDHFGVDSFMGCGSSYGALVTALLYFAQPRRMSRLILNASASCFNPEQQLAAGMRAALQGEGPGLRHATPDFWKARMQRTIFDPAAFPKELMMSLLTTYGQSWAIPAWERTVSDMADAAASRPYRIAERLEEIAVKTLLIWGRNDRGAPIGLGEQAVGRIPHARLLAFDRCGHLPMLEHPDRWNEAVSAFIAAD